MVVTPTRAWRRTRHLYLKEDDGTPSGDLDWAVAHKFGHMLGLADRYSEGFVSKVMIIIGKSGSRKTEIKPGYEQNIMGKHSAALESKNVDDLDKENAPSFLEDDDRVRLWVSRHTQADIAALTPATKINMNDILLNGWISGDDVDTIEEICKSASTHKEGQAIGRGLTKRLLDMTDLGQRTRVRVIIANLP